MEKLRNGNTVVSCHKPVTRSRRRWEEKISCCVRTFAGFPAPPLPPPPPSLKAATTRIVTRQSETTNGQLMYRAHYSSKNLLIPGASLRFPFTHNTPTSPHLPFSPLSSPQSAGLRSGPAWRRQRTRLFGELPGRRRCAQEEGPKHVDKKTRKCCMFMSPFVK